MRGRGGPPGRFLCPRSGHWDRAGGVRSQAAGGAASRGAARKQRAACTENSESSSPFSQSRPLSPKNLRGSKLFLARIRHPSGGSSASKLHQSGSIRRDRICFELRCSPDPKKEGHAGLGRLGQRCARWERVDRVHAGQDAVPVHREPAGPKKLEPTPSYRQEASPLEKTMMWCTWS